MIILCLKIAPWHDTIMAKCHSSPSGVNKSGLQPYIVVNVEIMLKLCPHSILFTFQTDKEAFSSRLPPSRVWA